MLHRRNFIQTAAVIAAASMVGFSSRLQADVLPVRRVGGPFLKTALNAYSFDALLNANARNRAIGLDLFALCDFAASQGFDGIDLTGYYFPGYPNAPEDSYLYGIKKHLHALGLAISGTGVRNDFTAADKNVRAEGVRRVKQWIEVAAKLGAPVLRVFADSQPPYHNWIEASSNATRERVEEWMAQDLRECVLHAQSFGVVVGLQNHGDFITTAEEHLRLLKKIDSPWCGAIVDTGRYLSADPYEDISTMAPYAVNWQIKTNISNKATSPRMDLIKLIKIIRRSGYRGYLPIETLSLGRKDYNPMLEVPTFLAELRNAIAQTA
jgi:sugar phosphate isomerase/epimerase